MNSSTTAVAALIDAGIDFTGGTLGGIATVLVGQPLDTIKVKLQTYPQLYKSSYQCLVQTFRQDGVAHGLYRGTVPSLVANVAENSILFCAYGVCQSTVANLAGMRTEELDTLHNATAGGAAAFFSSLALCPTELIKCRLQTLSEVNKAGLSNIKHSVSPWKLTRDIIRTEGVPGLFRGLASTWLREIPGYFFFFGGYEGARKMMCKPGQTQDDIGLPRTALAGGLGGVCLWVAIFPADVVKSRIQVLSIDGSNHTFRSVSRNILKHEGVRALYSGLAPTLVRTIPATAALFVTYELTKKYLSQFFHPSIADT